MARSSGKKYRLWTPEANAQLVCTPSDRLPEGDLVFFLLDAVPRLDLSRFYAPYEQEKRGAPPFDPALLVTLLLYSYAVGLFSSRKIALACERNLAFLAIVGDDRPDFRTISDFRKIHVDAFADVFVQTITLAAEAGMLGLGNLSFDGTKIKANASRHKAMSYGYMKKDKERLEAEIKELLQKAKDTDETEDAALGTRRGDELPDDLQRRQDRLATIDAAMKRLEEQARAEAEEERKRRAEEEAERQATGRKRRGKEPEPVSEEPRDKAQTNFTDPQTKIMPQSNKGWDYAGNAQVAVDGMFQIVVACFVTMATNDKQQGVPVGEATKENLKQAGVELPVDEQGKEKKIVATLDTGYFSEEAVKGLEQAGFDPHVATGRQKHNQGKGTPQAVGVPATATVKQKMAAKLATAQGKALYAMRKAIVEPVFGQIKGV